uniref:Wsv282-like protein n=1 Tax=Sesarmops intermedium nimavirus TaxID=2133796 RepID=A0A401IPM8_9VIRU|nr:MAG: wsv282-like protein [Sesarmops intermedium nimavirus]GBG35574.1 wsv282-like protein [Sesarmops intermedium nimavirus]
MESANLTSSSLLFDDLRLSSSSSSSNEMCGGRGSGNNNGKHKRCLTTSSVYSSSSSDEEIGDKTQRKKQLMKKKRRIQGPQSLFGFTSSSEEIMSSDESDLEKTDTEEEEEEEYDPDTDIVPGCSSWGLLMSRKHKEVKEEKLDSASFPLSPAPLSPSSFFLPSGRGIVDECVIPERILSVFSTLLEKDKFQFSQSVAFLRIVRKQVNEAMNSAFSTMLSSSGIRMCHNLIEEGGGCESGCKKVCDSEEEKRSAAMIRVAKALSNIAASSNPANSFQPAASVFNKLKSSSSSSSSSSSFSKKMLENHHNLSQVCSKVMFYREIYAVISLYLSLVYIQRAMNNDNTNSSGYSEGMVTKMLSIIGKIPHNEMSREKYVSVGRDALYLYQNVITDVTGPKHSKRLRTPQQQADFCYVIAMLVNDVPIASDLTLAGKATNLVQFASAMGDPAYRLAVHKMACVFNSSYSVYKVLSLERKSLICADQILSILSARNKSLSERKPRTLTQSVFLYLCPNLRDKLRASGLTSEESSLGTAVKLVSQQLRFEGIDKQSLEDGCSIISGSYDNAEGVTLKCLGLGIKDIKTVGLSTLMTDRIRKRIKRNLPFY